MTDSHIQDITCKNCKCERKEYNNDITGIIESTELD
nr:MAG TPA: NS26-like protein [Caudoviricetes sp.]